MAGKRPDLLEGRCPLHWEELLAPVVNGCFRKFRPRASLCDGASTWFALVGGPEWQGGDLESPLRSAREIGELPATELFTLANSLIPEEVRRQSLEEILSGETVLAHLLRTADPGAFGRARDAG